MWKHESANIVIGITFLGLIVVGFLFWWRFCAERPYSNATIVKWTDLKIYDKIELGDGSGFQLLEVDVKNETVKFKVWQSKEICEIVIKKQERVIPGYVLSDIRENKVRVTYVTAGVGHGRPFGDLLRIIFPDF